MSLAKLMGSLVEYRCPACRYRSGALRIGWGKAGRAEYWGGLAACPACKTILCLNLSDTGADRRDRRCSECGRPVRLLEGIAERIACPRCGADLMAERQESWS